MFKHGFVNPLNVFGLRRLTHCPPHFESVVFNLCTSEKVITDWIYENLAGRFFIGDKFVLDTNINQYVVEKVAGFEKVNEASYFCLLLPNINVSPF